MHVDAGVKFRRPIAGEGDAAARSLEPEGILSFVTAIFKTSSGLVVNVLFGAVAVKIFAVMTGPAGVGLWSLLKQVQATGLILGTSNGNAAFVRGLSGLTGDDQRRFIQASALIYLVLGALVTIALLLAAPYLSVWLKGVPAPLLMLMALPIAVSIARAFLLAVLNGHFAIGRLALAQSAGPVTAALLAYPLALWIRGGHYLGFVISCAASAFVGYLVADLFVRRARLLRDGSLRPAWCYPSVKHFFDVATPMLAMGIGTTLSSLIARGLVVRSAGLTEAGIFDCSWTLGSAYLALLFTSVSTYCLPKLAASREPEQIHFMQDAMRLLLIAALPALAAMITLKSLVVTVLYSHHFVPSLEMLNGMLIGDYLQIGSYLLAVALLANGRAKDVLWGSVLWDVGFVAAVYLSTQYKLGLGPVGLAAAALSACNLVHYYLGLRRILPMRATARLKAIWSAGLVLMIVLAVATWRLTTISAVYPLVGIISAMLLSYLLLTRSEIVLIRNFAFSKFRWPRGRSIS